MPEENPNFENYGNGEDEEVFRAALRLKIM